MTQVFRYSCDTGSLAIGCEGCIVCIHNSAGDGDFRVIVTDRGDFDSEGWIFETTCQGDAVTIYDYDCTGGEPLCVLSGRFAIYRSALIDNGDMAVVRWK